MDAKSMLIFLVISAVTGWLAGTFKKNGGFGFPRNIFAGIIGGTAGGILLKLLGHSNGGFVGTMTAAAVETVALLSVIARFKNAKEFSIHYKGD